MDFSRAPGGPSTHGVPAKPKAPVEPIEDEEQQLDTIPPVLPGPADRSGSSSPNPYTVEAPGVGLPGPSLAALAGSLNWKVP